MRIKVTPETILEYGLDTLTGNSKEELLVKVAELGEHGMDLFVNMPDVEGGDTETPEERNIFEHYNPDELPEPEGKTHSAESFDLTTQQYVKPCSYTLIFVGSKWGWVCDLHKKPSKHIITADSHEPCIEIDPYGS